jgi:hypothetical protein
MGVSARSGSLKLPAELVTIHAMLGHFLLADEDYRNIPAVALLQDRIGIYIDFPESGAEFAQERHDSSLGFVAEVASGTRVESDVAGSGSGKAFVFGMGAHRLSAKLHLIGEQAPLGRTGA